MTRRFALFCLVGGAGFLIDATTVQVLVLAIDWHPYAARVVSFIAASSFTWLANRMLTFEIKKRPQFREWLGYAGLMLAGALVNYTAFVWTLWLWPLAQQWPALGVAVGSIAGMALNYASMTWWFASLNAPPDR